jgi:hypothetical protein
MLMILESYLKIGIFTEQGRKRQANRMMTMCDLAVNHVVVDFVCPFESYRSFL